MMDYKDREALVSILREVQEIVEEALGASLSGSTVRDSMVINLSGLLVHDWYARREKAAKSPGLPRSSALPQEFMDGAEATLAFQREARVAAIALTAEMMGLNPRKAAKKEWVWETYCFFFQKAQEKEKDEV